MILTLNNGRIIEIKSVKTFMHGLGLKVVYPDGSRELFRRDEGYLLIDCYICKE